MPTHPWTPTYAGIENVSGSEPTSAACASRVAFTLALRPSAPIAMNILSRTRHVGCPQVSRSSASGNDSASRRTSSPSVTAGLRLRDRVLDDAERLDLHPHDVAVLEELRRVHRHADAARRAGQDQ